MKKSIWHCAFLGVGCLAMLNDQVQLGMVLLALGLFFLFKEGK